MLDLVSETARLDAGVCAQSIHALQGLVKLTRSRVGIVARVRRTPGKQLDIESFVDLGWGPDGEADKDRGSLIEAAMQPGYLDPMLEIGFEQYEKNVGKPSSCRREMFFSDSEWYSSQCYSDVRKPARIDDCVYSIFYLGQAGHYACLGLHRGEGDRTRYNERERHLADYVWQSLSWLHRLPMNAGKKETTRAEHSDPIASLSEDLRPVFNLIKGSGRLNNAHRKLGLSKGEYDRRVRQVYGHFGVSSRLELLARLLEIKGV